MNDVLRTTTKAALSVFLYYPRVWQEFYLFLKCLNQVFMSGKGKKRNIKLDSKGMQFEKIILTDFLIVQKYFESTTECDQEKVSIICMNWSKY